MRFKKEEIFSKSEEAAAENGLFFIDDIVAYIPCSRSTFYELFPDGSDELDILKGILSTNKIIKKIALRQKLFDGKGVELLALYKLIGTEEERKRLSQTYQDITTDGKELKVLGFLPEGFDD